MISVFSDYTLMTKLDRIIKLGLIDTENMTCDDEYSIDENNILRIHFETLPEANIFIGDVFMLNLYGNNLGFFEPESVDLEHTICQHETGIIFEMPSVNVILENNGNNSLSRNISATRTLQPIDLFERYEEFFNEEN